MWSLVSRVRTLEQYGVEETGQEQSSCHKSRDIANLTSRLSYIITVFTITIRRFYKIDKSLQWFCSTP